MRHQSAQSFGPAFAISGHVTQKLGLNDKTSNCISVFTIEAMDLKLHEIILNSSLHG